MLALAEADRVEILVLVDNVTDNLSSVPDYVDNELPRLWKRGLRRWSGRCMCCAAHGLSCAITGYARRHGPYAALRHRARRLGSRTQRRAAGVRHGQRRSARAVARPLGPCRRHAPRARNDRAAQWRPRAAHLHAPGHVPHARHEGGRRLDTPLRRRAERFAARAGRRARDSRPPSRSCCWTAFST